MLTVSVQAVQIFLNLYIWSSKMFDHKSFQVRFHFSFSLHNPKTMFGSSRLWNNSSHLQQHQDYAKSFDLDVKMRIIMLTNWSRPETSQHHSVHLAHILQWVSRFIVSGILDVGRSFRGYRLKMFTFGLGLAQSLVSTFWLLKAKNELVHGSQVTYFVMLYNPQVPLIWIF